MIKNGRITTIAIALGLMLTGCSETVTETAKDVKEEVTNENSNNLIEYSTEMEGYMNDFSITMQEFSDLNMEAAENPPVMASSEWMADISLNLINMDDHIEDIRAVTPPEEMEVSHGYVLKAMDSYEYVVDNYPDSLGDPGLMRECIDALDEGGVNLDKAILETSKVTY